MEKLTFKRETIERLKAFVDAGDFGEAQALLVRMLDVEEQRLMRELKQRTYFELKAAPNSAEERKWVENYEILKQVSL